MTVLVWQAVDQVKAQGAEIVGADAVNQWGNLTVWLDTVNRLLHQRVEVLDAEADAIEGSLHAG